MSKMKEKWGALHPDARSAIKTFGSIIGLALLAVTSYKAGSTAGKRTVTQADRVQGFNTGREEGWDQGWCDGLKTSQARDSWDEGFLAGMEYNPALTGGQSQHVRREMSLSRLQRDTTLPTPLESGV